MAAPATKERGVYHTVNQSYDEEWAMLEASRCLGCSRPKCEEACPVGVPIREFIGHIERGDFESAAEVLAAASSLPATYGRVCPQEGHCEEECVLGTRGSAVAIGRLERFVGDWVRERAPSEPDGAGDPNP